jgi:hypothetical protein
LFAIRNSPAADEIRGRVAISYGGTTLSIAAQIWQPTIPQRNGPMPYFCVMVLMVGAAPIPVRVALLLTAALAVAARG